MSEWVPAGRVGSVNAAEPAESVACANTVEPSLNWTTPVGEFAEALVTFELRNVIRPATAGLAAETSVVLVIALPAAPVPLSETVLVPTEVAIESVAVAPPIAAGLKVTSMPQPQGPATPEKVVQPLTCEKEVGLVPVKVMELMVSGIPPELFQMTVFTALLVPTVCEGKVSEVGERVTVAWVALLPPRLMVTVPTEVPIKRVALMDPDKVGLKVTLIVQPVLMVRVPGQLWVCAKKEGLVPPNV